MNKHDTTDKNIYITDLYAISSYIRQNLPIPKQCVQGIHRWIRDRLCGSINHTETKIPDSEWRRNSHIWVQNGGCSCTRGKDSVSRDIYGGVQSYGTSFVW